MTNTARIEKARLQFRDNGKGNQTSEDFKKAIQDNLPKQISVEAVKELRKSYVESMNDFKDMYDHGNGTVYGVRKTYERVIKDLDILLSQQQDDTN